MVDGWEIRLLIILPFLLLIIGAFVALWWQATRDDEEGTVSRIDRRFVTGCSACGKSHDIDFSPVNDGWDAAGVCVNTGRIVLMKYAHPQPNGGSKRSARSGGN